MQTVSVALPDSLIAFVDQQVAGLGYDDVGDYFRELVEADRLRKEKLALETEVLRGLHCQETVVFNTETWDEMRDELYQRLEQKRG